MTDQELIQKLIGRDNKVTKEFFFKQCKPLFLSVINKVFNYKVDYDEIVNELYIHLMEDDARRLRTFKFSCSIYGWLMTTAIRFFMDKKNHGRVIEDEEKDPLYEKKDEHLNENAMTEAQMDVERLLAAMTNERYAYVIRKLVLDDMDPDDLADLMGINTANLYNIKKRAIAQITQIALNDIKNYEKTR